MFLRQTPGLQDPEVVLPHFVEDHTPGHRQIEAEKIYLPADAHHHVVTLRADLPQEDDRDQHMAQDLAVPPMRRGSANFPLIRHGGPLNENEGYLPTETDLIDDRHQDVDFRPLEEVERATDPDQEPLRAADLGRTIGGDVPRHQGRLSQPLATRHEDHLLPFTQTERAWPDRCLVPRPILPEAASTVEQILQTVETDLLSPATVRTRNPGHEM